MSGNRNTIRAVLAALVLLGAGCVRQTTSPPANAPGEPAARPLTAVSYYLVALDGSPAFATAPPELEIGCRDRLALVREIIPSGESPLLDAVNRLLAVRTSDAAEMGLFTPFGAQDLRAEVRNENGKTVVDIIGPLSSGGECDDPRIKAMIEETAKLNNNGVVPEIRLNGSASAWRCFGDLSGRCQ